MQRHVACITKEMIACCCQTEPHSTAVCRGFSQEANTVHSAHCHTLLWNSCMPTLAPWKTLLETLWNLSLWLESRLQTTLPFGTVMYMSMPAGSAAGIQSVRILCHALPEQYHNLSTGSFTAISQWLHVLTSVLMIVRVVQGALMKRIGLVGVQQSAGHRIH